jgi:hypothetical protein
MTLKKKRTLHTFIVVGLLVFGSNLGLKLLLLESAMIG